MMADGAESTNGKIYILGGAVDRHMIAKDAPLPIQLRADIALGILVDWAETNNRHTFTSNWSTRTTCSSSPWTLNSSQAVRPERSRVNRCASLSP